MQAFLYHNALNAGVNELQLHLGIDLEGGGANPCSEAGGLGGKSPKSFRANSILLCNAITCYVE